MANLLDKYTSVPVTVKYRQNENDYVVCAAIGGAEIPFGVISVAKLNKYLDRAASEQAAAAAAQPSPETSVPGEPAPPVPQPVAPPGVQPGQ